MLANTRFDHSSSICGVRFNKGTYYNPLKMVRPERFELPTPRFEAYGSNPGKLLN